MMTPATGPLLGEAACFFEDAYRALLRGVLRLDAAGLDVDEVVGTVIDDVAWISAGATSLADQYAADCAAAAAALERRAG